MDRVSSGRMARLKSDSEAALFVISLSSDAQAAFAKSAVRWAGGGLAFSKSITYSVRDWSIHVGHEMFGSFRYIEKATLESPETLTRMLLDIPSESDTQVDSSDTPPAGLEFYMIVESQVDKWPLSDLSKALDMFDFMNMNTKTANQTRAATVHSDHKKLVLFNDALSATVSWYHMTKNAAGECQMVRILAELGFVQCKFDDAVQVECVSDTGSWASHWVLHGTSSELLADHLKKHAIQVTAVRADLRVAMSDAMDVTEACKTAFESRPGNVRCGETAGR